MLILIIEKENPQVNNINNVIRDQLQRKHITKLTKVHNNLHCITEHTHHTKKYVLMTMR